MKLRVGIILTLIAFLSFSKVKAQVSYNLNLETCIINDTLYIAVTTDNLLNDFAFANANFVFDVYNSAGVIGATNVTGLDFANKFIAYEGPWSAVGGNSPDYQDMTLGANLPQDFFNLSINVFDTTGNNGYTIPAGTSDTIGVIGVPLINDWCGDTIDLVWRDEANTTWPNYPFQRGNIHQWVKPTYPSIYNDAIFINNYGIILCEGCGVSGIGGGDTLSQGDTTICVNESLTFDVLPGSTDTVTFYVNGAVVQQGTSNTLTYQFLNVGIDTVYAVIGDPSCQACGYSTDTTLVTVNTGAATALTVTPFGCDSVNLSIDDLWTNYEWYRNGVLVSTTTSPDSSYNFLLSANDSFAVIATGGAVCPDSIFLDTVITNVSSSGIVVDLGPVDTAFCLGSGITLNSGFIPNPPIVTIDWFLGANSIATNVASISPVASGLYYAVVDSNGCTGTDSINVFIGNAVATVSAIDTNFCSGTSLQLNSTGSIGGVREWFLNPAAPVSQGTTASINITVGGTYFLVMQDTTNGANCSDTAFITITEAPCAINACFDYDTVVCINTSVNVITDTCSVGDTAWFWHFGPGATPQTSTSPLPGPVVYSTGGNKIITLVVYGAGGISDTIQHTIFVEGGMPTPTVTTSLNTCDSMVFSWNPVTGATGYEVSYNINGGGWSPFAPGNIDQFNQFVLVSSLDVVDVRVLYFNNCTTDTVYYQDQAYACNCPIQFNQIQPGDFCLDPKDSICFEITNVVMPINQNGVSTNGYEINWANNINNTGDVYCPTPNASGNYAVDFIIFSTDVGANCYVEGQMNVQVNDTLVPGDLEVETTNLGSSEVCFGWNPVPNADDYVYNMWVNGIQQDVLTSTGGLPSICKYPPYYNTCDTIEVQVFAINDCDTIENNTDTIVVVACDSCFIGKLQNPNKIPNACAFDCYDLEVNVTSPASWQIEWLSPGVVAQGPNRDNTVTYCPPTPNVTDYVIYEITDTAYTGTGTCSLRDTFEVIVEPAQIPNWDVKTDFCITSFPYQIDVDASPSTGWFYVTSPTDSSAVYLASDGNWYFDPQIAGVGLHEVVFKVCGDSLVRTFDVGDVPCVTTVFNEVGSRPDGIWSTCDGMIYYSDATKNAIYSIDTNGVRTKILGDTTQAFRDFLATCPSSANQGRFRDGHRSFAKVVGPRGLVVIEGTKDIYFADSYNHKIRKYISSSQEIITVAGPKTSAVSSDNPAANSSAAVADSLARFDYPWGMTMDCDQNYIYFTDIKNQKMRRLQIGEGGTFSAPYFVENVVGNSGTSISSSVPGLSGRIELPFSSPNICGEQVPVYGSHITLDGNFIYIPDPNRHMVYRYDILTDTISPFVTRNFSGYADGLINLGGTGMVNAPVGSAVIPGADSVYFSDNGNYAIRSGLNVNDNDSYVTTISGSPPASGAAQGDADGPLLTARYGSPTAMRFAIDGNIYICDAYGTPTVGSIRSLSLDPALLDPFYGMDSIYCMNDPQDTLTSPYAGGVFSVIQGDPSVLTQFGVSDTFFFNPVIADTFILQYTAQVGCCPRTWTHELVVLPPPVPVVDSIIFSCDPTTTVVPVQNPDSSLLYVWTDTSGTILSTNDTLFGVGAGTYYVMATDTISGCSGYDTAIVVLGFTDTLEILAVDSICFGDSTILTFDTTGFQTWWWSTGDSTNQITVSSGGVYVAYAANGSCITTDTHTIIAKPLPPICVTSASDTLFGRWQSRVLSSGHTALWDVHLSQDGNTLYYTEEGTSNVIRTLDLNTGTSSLFAGSTTAGGYVNSTLTNSEFNHPYGVYEAFDGMVYVADRFNHVIRKIDPVNNIVSDFSGIAGNASTSDSTYNSPFDIVGNGLNFYVADFSNHRIAELDQNGNITNYSGQPGLNCSTGCDGARLVARHNWPSTIDLGPGGNIYNVDNGNSTVRQNDHVNLTTIGLGASPVIDNPWGIAVDPFGNVWITDQFNQLTRIIKPDGSVEDITGAFNIPRGIEYDPYRNVAYVANNGSNEILEIYRQDTIFLCEGELDTLDASCSGADTYSWTNLTTGQSYGTTPIAYIDTAGVYVLEVSLDSCFNSDTFYVISTPVVVPDINGMTPGRLDSIFGCQGDSIFLDADTTGVTYNWTSTSPFTGLPTDSIILTDTSGRYIVEVINAAGCSAFDTVDVVLDTLPFIGDLDTNFCFGESYTVDLSSYGFDSIIWNGTLDTMIRTFDTTGNYVYQAYLNGCFISDTVNVYSGDSLYVNIGDSIITSCLGDSVLLVASPLNYGSYLWSTGDTTQSILVGDSGVYHVTVSDSLSLQCTVSDTVEVNFIPAPVFTIPNSLFVCNGESLILTPNDSSLPYQFDTLIVSNYDTLTSTDDSVIITASGTYYVSAVLGSCIDYDTFTVGLMQPIIVNPVPVANYALQCGTNIQLGSSPTASGGSGNGFIYDWEPDTLVNDTASPNPTTTFTTTGYYTFTLTVTDSSNQTCPVDTSIQIYYQSPPEQLVLGDTNLCYGEEFCVDLAEDSISTLVWYYQGPNDNSYTFGNIHSMSDSTVCYDINSMSNPGENWVDIAWSNVITATGPVGSCPFTDVDTFRLFIADTMLLDAGTDTSICPLDTISLGGNPTASGGSYPIVPGDFVYTWSSLGGTTTPNPVSNPIVNPVVSDTFVVTVTDTFANCVQSDQVTINVYPTPVIDAGIDITICAGDTTTLSGTASPFDTSMVISWSTSTGTTDSLCFPNSLVTCADPTDTTTYYLTVQDTIGCSALYDSVTVNVNAVPVALFNADTVCADTITTLTSSTIGNLTWTSTGQTTQTGSPVTYSFGTGGTYSVTLLANNGGCADTITQNVVVYGIPAVDAGVYAPYCITDTVSLDSAVGAGSLAWSTNSGGTFSNTTILNPIYNPSGAGVDTLTLALIDSNGCRNIDTTSITVADTTAAVAGVYDAGCSSTGIVLNGATGVGTFVWSSSGDGTFDSTGVLNATYQFGPGDLSNEGVTLTLTSTSAPCPSSTSSTSLGINPSAEAVITATVSNGSVMQDSLVEIFVDEGITFDYLSSVNYLIDSTGWDLNGDGIIDELTDSYFEIFTSVDTSYIYLYASNEFGCYDWDTMRVDVIGNQVVYIPNVFNPTDLTNPLNSTLRVFGTNVLDNDEFDFKLYNRWGELIFSSTSFTEMNSIGWDGVHQDTGEEQALGVYTYTVKGQFRDGKIFEKVGNVTLIR